MVPDFPGLHLGLCFVLGWLGLKATGTGPEGDEAAERSTLGGPWRGAGGRQLSPDRGPPGLS